MEEQQPDRMSWKREIPRGLFHWSIGVTGDILLIPAGISDALMNSLLLGVGAVIMGCDQLRQFVPKDLHGSNWLTSRLKWFNGEVVERFLVRESEKRSSATSTQSWIGLILVWSICPRWVAVMAAMLFSHADPFAKLGTVTPVYKFHWGFSKGKSLGGVLWGTTAGLFAMGLMIGQQQIWPYLPTGEYSSVHCYLVYITGALVAPWIELYSGKLDNMTIPLGSGLVMYSFHALFILFGF